MNHFSLMDPVDGDYSSHDYLAAPFDIDAEWKHFLEDRFLYFAREQNMENLRAIVERGVDVNAHYHSFTALYFACKNGDAEMTSYLLENGSCIDQPSGVSLLEEAIRRGYETIVAILLRHGADPRDTDKGFGRTPLHYAALRGNTSICKDLVDHGANIYAEDIYGRTPIDLAAGEKHAEVISLFQTYIDIEIKEYDQ